MIVSRRLLAGLALALLAAAGCAPSTAETAQPAAAAATALTPLSITTAKGVVHFRVEVASTPEQQERGLMYRTSLPEHGGMIFPMAPPRFAIFWMKNTYIPLDMIFIRPDGHIARIAPNTVPRTLDPVESGEPVSAVLEIVGGGAAANGIVAGDRVKWRHDG